MKAFVLCTTCPSIKFHEFFLMRNRKLNCCGLTRIPSCSLSCPSKHCPLTLPLIPLYQHLLPPYHQFLPPNQYFLPLISLHLLPSNQYFLSPYPPYCLSPYPPYCLPATIITLLTLPPLPSTLSAPIPTQSSLLPP